MRHPVSTYDVTTHSSGVHVRHKAHHSLLLTRAEINSQIRSLSRRSSESHSPLFYHFGRRRLRRLIQLRALGSNVSRLIAMVTHRGASRSSLPLFLRCSSRRSSSHLTRRPLVTFLVRTASLLLRFNRLLATIGRHHTLRIHGLTVSIQEQFKHRLNLPTSCVFQRIPQFLRNNILDEIFD